MCVCGVECVWLRMSLCCFASLCVSFSLFCAFASLSFLSFFSFTVKTRPSLSPSLPPPPSLPLPPSPSLSILRCLHLALDSSSSPWPLSFIASFSLRILRFYRSLERPRLLNSTFSCSLSLFIFFFFSLSLVPCRWLFLPRPLSPPAFRRPSRDASKLSAALFYAALFRIPRYTRTRDGTMEQGREANVALRCPFAFSPRPHLSRPLHPSSLCPTTHQRQTGRSRSSTGEAQTAPSFSTRIAESSSC